jgi:hypothetical protein
MPLILTNTKVTATELASMILDEITLFSLTDVEIEGDEDDIFTLAKALRGHPDLQSFTLVNVKSGSLDQAISMMLVSCYSLKTMKMQNAPVSATAIASCAFCTTLHTLELPEMSLDDNAAATIAAALINNSSISTLDLSNNNLSDKGCTAIASALEKNTTVRTVKLDGNGQISSGELDRLMELTRSGGRAQAA